MRVVLAVERFPEVSQTFIVQKVLGLLTMGVDVHVVCRESDPEAWAWFPTLVGRADVRARVHETAVGSDPRRVGRAVARLVPGLVRCPRGAARYFAAGARRHGRGVVRQALDDSWFVALRPDLVHVEFGSDSLARLPLKSLLGCPLTVSFRGFDLNFVGLDRPHLYDELWSTVDGIHCLGEDLWRRARARGCPADVPHVLIPPAVDVERFAPSERTSVVGRPLRVLTVARLHWKKGLPDGLAAIRMLLDRGLEIEHRIVGAGVAEEEVQACVRDLALERHVSLLGARSPDEVREQMQWADVLLHPAVSEGFCNAVLEAQAMALPVVCTDADGLGENVAHGESGFVVPRRRPAALADAVEVLATDPALRAVFGAAGRRRAAEVFPATRQIDAFVEFFVGVVARTGA